MQIRKGRWFAVTLLLPLAAVLSLGQEAPRRDAPSQAGARQRREGPGRNVSFPLSQALDIDRDGKLSAKEIEAASAALKALDANHDGKVSAEEIGWPPRRFGPGGGPPPFGGPQGESGRARQSLAQRVMSRDANGDGRVTIDELPKSMHFRLRLADANGDGAIDAQEAERLFRQLGLDAPTPSAKPLPAVKQPDASRATPRTGG
jgi:Ca2+-binding EF-hand superfamily protein